MEGGRGRRKWGGNRGGRGILRERRDRGGGGGGRGRWRGGGNRGGRRGEVIEEVEVRGGVGKR